MPAGRRANSHASDRNTSTRGGQTTRTVQLQAYSYDNTEVADERGAVTLRLRRPEDQRRERVQFVLSGLDLL